jgi:cytochrome c oxidase subunit IV
MSSDASTATRDEPHSTVGHHPTPRDYVRIGIILAVLTAMEVSVYFIEFPSWLVFWGLVVLAIIKFALVVLYFMHAKFDSKLYQRLFTFGVILAAVVFGLFLLIAILGTPGSAQA